MQTHPEIFDVAVIGGGPAGMMAAGRAAESGARVVLIEKNSRPGRKLLLTGNGRCNLTNAEPDARRLVERYGREGKFLFSAFSVFGVAETLGFFERMGVSTKTEESNRVFPKSDRAQDVLSALLDYTKTGGVTLLTGSSVEGLEVSGGRVVCARLADGSHVAADSFIVCTGGRSYPKTGSTGEGFKWLKALGHTLTPQRPALTPVRVKETWVRDVEGASLTDAGLTAYLDGRNKFHVRGDAVFTRDGLSGPMVFDISGAIGGLMDTGTVTLSLDLIPDEGTDALDGRMQEMFALNQNRRIKNCISGFLTPKLAPTYMALAGIDGEERINKLTREERQGLVRFIKGAVLTVSGLGGFDRAMLTKGGVSLKEVDGKTMRSKVVENLFLAGEVLDLDGPTGGYNLQICWSTGYVAGKNAAYLASAR